MWRIIKAEVAIYWLQALVTTLAFSVMSVYVFPDREPGNDKETLWRLINFIIMGLMFPSMFIRMAIQKREFAENRVRLMMLLPYSTKEIGNVRLLVFIILVLLVTPIWFIALSNLGYSNSWQLIWLILSLFSAVMVMAFATNMANEIQYFEKVSKIKTLIWFWSVGLLVLGGIIGAMWKPLRELYLLAGKALPTVWGALIFLGLAIILAILNRRAFEKRITYFDIHKPEVTVFDFLRTFRGERQYRNQK